MADTSRKRSRKSKLVPRDCAVDEKYLELQVPATKISKYLQQTPYTVIIPPEPKTRPIKLEPIAIKHEPIPIKTEPVCDTSVLKKINASAKQNSPVKTSPRKFEINIEVESCGDDNEVKEDFAIYQNSPKQKTDNSIVKKTANPSPIPLNVETILNAVGELSTTNIADKILNIHVRNTIGDEQQREKLVCSRFETKIQQSLEKWRNWHSRSSNKIDLLFYKCYICTKSYWRLADFRIHLASIHAGDGKLRIFIEKYGTHEANMVASHKKLGIINDIYSEGSCYRCGKDYAAHELLKRHKEKYYMEHGCSKQFSLCTDMREHVPSCEMCNVAGKPLQCDICKSKFNTENELENHLVLTHSVRSDEPIVSYYNNCMGCLERYACKFLHRCTGKTLGPNFECPHCFKSFSNYVTVDLHVKSSLEPYKCEVCNTVMPFSCMKYDHMLSHTANYKVVKKCIICDELNVFLDINDAKAHWIIKHKGIDFKCKIYFPIVFVPTSCISEHLSEINSKKEESLSEVKKSLPSSVLERQDSGPDEQEWESDENIKREYPESDVDIKEPILDFEVDSVSARLQEKLDKATKYSIENIAVKEEPEDSDYSPRLVIKEEPLDIEDNQILRQEHETEDLADQITVKQEIVEEDEESDAYEGDLIKLNFNIEDLLINQEGLESEDIVLNESQNSDAVDDNSQESASQTQRKDKKNKNRLYKCTKCGFEGRHKQYKQHKDNDCINSFIDHRYFKCTKCDTIFKSMRKFLQHLDQHGYISKACPECRKHFNDYTGLGQHIHWHVRQNFVRFKLITSSGDAMTRPDYRCKKCSETVQVKDFFQHWESHLKAQPSNLKFEPIEQLHESAVKECIALLYQNPKACYQCDRPFKRVNECKRHLIQHLLVHAYNLKHIYHELRCQICVSGFPTSDKYKHHMRNHASLPVYKCELCNKAFSDSSNFTKHKKVHNLKCLICNLCGKKFQSKLTLEKHIEQHRNTEPIKCNYCSREFDFATMYRRHCKNIHDKGATVYRCVICGERFKTLKQKWDHMWIVHKERKHICDCPVCHTSFRKFSDVRAHARSVHGVEVCRNGIESVITVNTDKMSQITKKKMVKTHCFLNETVVKPITISDEVETLIVYDSD